MAKEESVRFTREELDYYQPEITKLMRGLQIHEKCIIIKECIKDYKNLILGIQNLSSEDKLEILKDHILKKEDEKR